SNLNVAYEISNQKIAFVVWSFATSRGGAVSNHLSKFSDARWLEFDLARDRAYQYGCSGRFHEPADVQRVDLRGQERASRVHSASNARLIQSAGMAALFFASPSRVDFKHPRHCSRTARLSHQTHQLGHAYSFGSSDGENSSMADGFLQPARVSDQPRRPPYFC